MNKKTIRKTFISIGALAILSASALSMVSGKGYTALFAHQVQLDVMYDSCIPEYYIDSNDIGDGEDEKWYELVKNDIARHLPHASSGVSEIKYYLSETAYDSNDLSSWNDITDSTRREYVKTSFVNSLKKWNNINFYNYSSNSFITKHRIVNISEGTSSNHNLTIYPLNDYYGAYASCNSVSSSGTLVDIQNGVSHYHYTEWYINFNIAYHYYETNESEHILNRTGAHEFGHIMGLRDIDSCESNSSLNYHHEEILMGYSNYNGSVEDRQSEITYKDLIGAAITRGLHTDSEHQWILHSYTNNEYKLICSICNGVKYVTSLNGIDYVDYKDCDDEHDLVDGNMFAVASYGNRDYYKCRYCRYVAPFSDMVQQNYSLSQANSYNHLVTNQVNGLGYSFYEPHSYNNLYLWRNYTQHYANCSCGSNRIEGHAVPAGAFNGVNQYATCLACGGLASIGFVGPLVFDDLPITSNGSFILPNGVTVLAEDDYVAYFDGALTFNYQGLN